MDEELSNYPDAMKVRASTVEHPFGTIKLWMGTTHFLMKRLENVQTEMSLHVLAYNMERMISILGVAALIEVIQAQASSVSSFIQANIRHFAPFYQMQDQQ